MRFIKNEKGQFIVIAVLMIALMIISLGATMFSMGTYYKQEQWEEYLTLIEQIKVNTVDLVDISLSSYTSSETFDTEILKTNLDLWKIDLRKAYPGHGIILAYDLAKDVEQVYNTSISYNQGLAKNWNEPVSFSAVKTNIALNMTSIGLEGYQFEVSSFLELAIISVDDSDSNSTLIIATVFKENGIPVTDLNIENFEIDNQTISGVTSYYDPDYMLVYSIYCDGLQSSNVTITVHDQRFIKVVSTTTVV